MERENVRLEEQLKINRRSTKEVDILLKRNKELLGKVIVYSSIYPSIYSISGVQYNNNNTTTSMHNIIR